MLCSKNGGRTLPKSGPHRSFGDVDVGLLRIPAGICVWGGRGYMSRTVFFSGLHNQAKQGNGGCGPAPHTRREGTFVVGAW